ncbi:MAG: N-acetyltransferase [Sphingomonadales bacterium]|nr:MAG: N-acetyltransferase [Sphingomonadales bacterium]
MQDIIDNHAHRRFELELDGHLAFAAYELDGDVVTFTHTVVPPELQGQGVATRLIGAALADVRSRGRKLIAECTFVRAYLDKHPEDRDLIAA